jgi:hypothetical protein
MLENSSFPFATKILEAIKRNEEAAAQGGALQGIPPELMSQLQSGNLPQKPQPGEELIQSAVSAATNQEPAVPPINE